MKKIHIGTQSVHARSHIPQDRFHRRNGLAFDPEDPTLMDRYPRYDIDKRLGNRPPTPIQH